MAQRAHALTCAILTVLTTLMPLPTWESFHHSFQNNVNRHINAFVSITSQQKIQTLNRVNMGAVAGL